MTTSNYTNDLLTSTVNVLRQVQAHLFVDGEEIACMEPILVISDDKAVIESALYGANAVCDLDAIECWVYEGGAAAEVDENAAEQFLNMVLNN